MIADIAEKVYAGERLTLEDARRLYKHHNLVELGMLTTAIARMTVQRPAPIAASSNSASITVGKDIRMSRNRWLIRSNLPPI